MPKHLYVIAVAYDEEAILKTLFQASCDKVCLLSTKLKEDRFRAASDLRTQEVERNLLKRLQPLVEVDVVRFNWRDHMDMIDTLTTYLEQHRDWDVTINYAFGSTRLTPVLLMVASLFDLRLEYTFCNEFREELLQGDWHTGLHDVEVTPTLPVHVALSEKEARFLSLTQQRGTLHAQEYVDAVGGDKPKARAEFHYYADKLAERDFVTVSEEGHRHAVSLTSTGTLVLRLHQR